MTREEIYSRVEKGEYPIGKAIFHMRRSIKVNRVDFSKKIGMSKRTLEQIEQEKGNPTVNSLNKILNAFGFELGIKKK